MNKKPNKVIMIVQFLLAIFCALCCIYTIIMGDDSGAQQLPAFTILTALISTVYYAMNGYQKDVSSMYKTMMILCAISALMCIVPHMYNYEIINNMPVRSTLCVLGFALSFSFYLMLAFVTDLGERKTNILIAMIFFFFLIVFVSSIVTQPGSMFGDGTRYDSMRSMRHFSMMVLAINAGICSYFKYQDKKVRGSH